jgi:AAA domain
MDPIVVELPLDQPPDAVGLQELTPQLLHSLGVLSPSMVDRICDDRTQTRFLVEGLLPIKSIAIMAGDSTIGKSPLVLQLALCVAAGVPFLGMPTNQGRVLYFDLENPLPDCKDMRDALVRFLGLNQTPKDFLLAPEPLELEQRIEQIRPHLVVIDSLRSFCPGTTENNFKAGEWLKKIRSLCRKYGCCILFVHHLRKEEIVPSLEPLPVVTWMQGVEGPRAFVNQTDVRIAADRETLHGAALGLKWSRRVYGDSPYVLLERIFDDDGAPAGYRQLSGVALLSPERRKALEKLPAEFRFKDAKIATGVSDDPTTKILRECIHLGLLVKARRGVYRKIRSVVSETHTQESVPPLETVE